MIMLQRKLKCKFVGDKKYLPDNIPDNAFIPVVGYEIRKRTMRIQGKEPTLVEDVYYLVIDNKGKLIPVASFNCETVFDDDEKMMRAIAMNTGAMAEIASMLKAASCEGEIVVRTGPIPGGV